MKKFVTAFLILAVSLLSLAANGTAETAADTPVIAFETTDIFGNEVSSAELFAESRITMLNIWATYCSPCIGELPFLGKIPSEYDKADLQIIGVISDVFDQATYDTAISLITSKGAHTYPHLLVSESLYNSVLKDIVGVPTTLFVDSEGHVLKTVVGSNTLARWKEIITSITQ
ncbi:MAG: TlpA disulfide reductase family protein [Bullifex sp.]|nr:TlpA disulfide reductase family protein [Bullifex sp.]